LSTEEVQNEESVETQVRREQVALEGDVEEQR
jgi:hypothetical protein